VTDKRIEEKLERVARELATTSGRFFQEIYENDLAVLRRELLPLLLAGQAMRQGIGAYAVALNTVPFKQEYTCAAIRDCVDSLRAWDAALAGSEESSDGK